MKKNVMRVTAVMIAVAIVALCLAGCTACGGASAGKYDWPRWRGPNGDGISRETGWNPKALEGGPRIAWQVNVGAGYSSVAIRGNRLYTMGWPLEADSSVYCLDASSGKELWQYPVKGMFPQATPAVDGSSVYCLGKGGILLCLDAGDGKLRWEKNLVAEYDVVKPAYGFAGSPVVVGNLLILTANTSGIALDKNTGERAWVSERPPKTVSYGDSSGTEYHTPVIYAKNRKRYAIVSSWKGVFSVEVETGKPFLLFDWEESYFLFRSQIVDPVVVGDKVLVVGPQKKDPGTFLLDMQGQGVKVLWKSEGTFAELGSPIFFDGHFYVSQGGGDMNGSLRCIDPKTGKVEWEEFLGGGLGHESVLFTVADGKLIVLNDKGMLSIAEASPEGFHVLSSCNVLAGKKQLKRFWTSPVLCNGMIYCRDLDGDLICIDVRK